MRNNMIKITVLLFVIFLSACKTKKYKTKKNNPLTEENLYYGNKPPGLTPEIFVPKKSTSQDWVLWNTDSLDMDEFYFTHEGNDPFEPLVVVYRNEGNYYKVNKYSFKHNPSDRNILYSRWNYIERKDSGWSKIKSLGSMFDKEDLGIMVMSVSSKGTLVFDDYKSNDGIRISRIIDGKREEPKLLGKEINSGEWTAHPFIAPDESYLIWDSERQNGYGKSDLYISFRQQDGSWGSTINMGNKINSELVENGARLTPDGKYLLFERSEEKVREDGSKYWESKKYWVDSKIIERLKLE
ncbi:PD40 domain-containing protein [Flavobacterium sp. CLA17]|uniref:PD40 domain-containing protein n=1 Tax=Flavobacterium sp. CLA17 TaxID=2724135 RepID=UPI001490A595|nr:PD40 domain-containing protein [Flavobacterium sp. CLA17]QSB29215.1 PD40 domain-containing protein [Flavobacterium sp. CLA17]